MLPTTNVLNLHAWNPLVANDNFLKTIKQTFEALNHNPFDIKYCVMQLRNAISQASNALPLVRIINIYGFCCCELVEVPN